ncbi:hypothetical protein I3842_05G206500 [Carya illinoinensis]|uniref:YqaJ viral recombinase domain-containing protein n=1 Tax=Carya illinoinensis TaxID=32201 RepID=A0A922F5M2_CARIL|nr:hypothetical protein I3842_05G206500 [Carya illinoinensis]
MFWSPHKLARSNLKSIHCMVVLFTDPSNSRSYTSQHWFKNWQKLRQHKLTASTFAAAIGFWHRRRVQLWLEKIGAIEPFSGNLATFWSNIKEEEALERYKLITGNTVLFPEFQVYGGRNPEDDWLACSPDGVVDRLVYDLPSRGVLEIKCPFFNGDMSRLSLGHESLFTVFHKLRV